MSVAFMRAWEESKEGGAPTRRLTKQPNRKSKIVDNNYKKWEKLLKNQHKTMQMRKRDETYFVLVKAIFVSPFCTLS